MIKIVLAEWYQSPWFCCFIDVVLHYISSSVFLCRIVFSLVSNSLFTIGSYCAHTINSPRMFCPKKSNTEFNRLKDVVAPLLLVLSIILNHWLPGSHVFPLLKHLQVFVTIILVSGSTSKQTIVPLSSWDERCIFESEICSHFEVLSLQNMLSFAGFPNASACKQKYVPFTVSVFCCE